VAAGGVEWGAGVGGTTGGAVACAETGEAGE